MALVNGATYRFLNRATEKEENGLGRSLNVYGNSPSYLANVCLFKSNDGDVCQQWIYKESGGHKYLICKGAPSLVLDLFTGSSAAANVTNYNAHVFNQLSNTCYLEIEPLSGNDSGYIRIRLANYTNKYLTANQGSNGSNTGKDVNAPGNVYFYNGGLTDYSQDWKPIRLDGGTDPDPDPKPDDTTPTPIDPPAAIESVNIMQRYNAPLPFTGSTITICNVEDDNSTEYYHRGSGFRPSESGENFLDTANGQTVLSAIQNFAKTVFRRTSLPGRSSVAYYLFGEYDSSAKFHHGVDMNVGDGLAIRPFWGGKVVARGGAYGRVQIYVPELDVTTVYMHMKNIPGAAVFDVGDTIDEDTIIGYQSNVSPYSIGSHLHFEVRKGYNEFAGDNTASDKNKALTSIIPYGYMKK